ncbi:ferredoxin-thioredoxin reductase catalytic domain-containing protein [Hominenteromicrobium sp.]|uniref:ferredoxin-thioredoxin reductase catalytic domain-containing protein n=1 Tax=Hominenteromicrobium sp. TaxID=3073581 RepID=UPI003AF1A33E
MKKDFGKNYCPCPLLKKQLLQKYSSCLLLKKQIKNKYFSCLLFLTTTEAKTKNTKTQGLCG